MKKFLIFVCFMVFCLSAYGQAEKIVLVTGEWAPFTSEQMEGYGFITEVVSLTLKEMGVEPEYQFYPWKRCEYMVEQAEAWAAFPYTQTEERAARFLFSEPVGYSNTTFFYYNTPQDFKYDQLEDLKAYKIGGISGYFYEEIFSNAEIKVYYSPSEFDAFKVLMLGRVDLLPVNELVGWNLIKTHFPEEINNFGTLERPLSGDELRLLVSKIYPDSQTLLNQFNVALKKVQNTEEYKTILKKYGLE